MNKRLLVSLIVLALLATAGGVIFYFGRARPAARPSGTPTAPRVVTSPAAVTSSPTPPSTAEAAVTQTSAAAASIPRLRFQNDKASLTLEILSDDCIHFEWSSQPQPTATALAAIPTSPMIVAQEAVGPSRWDENGTLLQTAALRLDVESASLCVTFSDLSLSPPAVLTRLCPNELDEKSNLLTLTPEGIQNVYGLGEQFSTEGLDWVGRVRRPGNEFGNAMTSFSLGATGNAQFPIMYAVGERENYALFLDSVYAQQWDFRAAPWQVSVAGHAVRGYLLAGPNLPDLRADFMRLVGHPPLPPRKMFGLWVSEYGYDNWAELQDKLTSLRANAFPLDGFVLDLQWFGGIAEDESTHMGYLNWDTSAFRDPPSKIAELRAQGVGLMLIEESYVGKRTPSYAPLQAQGLLVKKKEGGDPVTLFGWWGFGGMLDWTNPAAGAYWHDEKRQPLIEMGILGHWTDLGEPEMFQKTGWYYGFPQENLHSQADVHNIYNFRWSESIAEGYARHGNSQRPFILSRSGTAGIQRFGTAMWSGDIGADWVSLAAQMDVQAHLSFSGVDYFGADIGGFHRGELRGEALDALYTAWFAAASLLDVPVRAHTENLCNCKETAPDRVGDLASNRANIRLRYQLIPYLYSLAYRAWLFGEPLSPPLVFYYQNDANTRQIGDEKLLGRALLLAPVTAPNAVSRRLYLPAGTWINYYTNETIISQGQWLEEAPAVYDGLFRPLLFAHAGAILPQIAVDEQTLDALGLRADGSRRDELIVRVYPDTLPSAFTLYEDDGQSVAYQSGDYRATELAQVWTGNSITVTVGAGRGDYAGAPSTRVTLIELVFAGSVKQVTLNGETLTRWDSPEAFAAAESGWYAAADGVVHAKSVSLDIASVKSFLFQVEP